MKEKLNRSNIIKYICLASISIIIFSVFMFLFNAQLTTTDDTYRSDIQDHLRIALSGTGYSLLYTVIKVLYNLTGSTTAIAVFHSLMMMGTWLATGKFIDVIFERKNYFTSALIALPSMIATGIYIPKIYMHYYSQQLMVQPYHNITYTGMRFFAVFAMIVFFRIFEKYLTEIKWYQWLLLAGLLAISTSVKPNFFYGFALTLLIFLLIDFFTTKFRISKFSKMLTLGYTVFPSLFIMWKQSQILYTSSRSIDVGESGIAIVWGENFVAAGAVPTILKIVCTLTLPVLVAVFNFKNLKRIEKFAYLMYAVQLAIVILFAETGPRANHGNFLWGLYCAGFILFAVVFTRVVDNIRNYKNYNKIYLTAAALLSMAHVLSGIKYLIHVLSGIKPWSI